jgi:hypothetical protein
VDCAEAFLADQIPLALRSQIPSTMKTAYDAAALLIREEPILNVTSAQDNRGRIIQGRSILALSAYVKVVSGLSISAGAISSAPPGATSKFFLHIQL